MEYPLKSYYWDLLTDIFFINKTMVNLIVAISSNYGIGLNNELLFKNSEDMKFFKKMTQNNIVIMGRKTFESLNYKPLPNRKNIVISTDKKFTEKYNKDDVFIFDNVQKTLEYCKEILKFNEGMEIFVIGGAQIYEYFLEHDLIDKIYCNKFLVSKEADKFFPKLDKEKWTNSNNHLSKDKKFEYKVFYRV